VSILVQIWSKNSGFVFRHFPESSELFLLLSKG
jgi:hypothetical protein